METKRNEAKAQMANEKSRKRSYQRAHKDKYPVVSLITEIPEELAMPWSSRFALEGDASFGQSYLIFQDNTPGFEMAIFTSLDNLQQLHRLTHWVLDGNFKYQPKGLQQLYTIHGFIKTPTGQKEAKTLVATVMNTRTREMYKRLFGFVRKIVALCMLSPDHIAKALELVCIVLGDLDGNEECACRDPAHPALPLGTETKLDMLRFYFEKLVFSPYLTYGTMTYLGREKEL
uniref:Uncharacterized protein n=1 Tax=Plectus sambesii TaxID=2011161 RepID=A0A914VP15_9BILA